MKRFSTRGRGTTPSGWSTAGAGSASRLAIRVYAVIGGVIGYYTDMVDHDLPDEVGDFERWIASRVLSPAATLHHEATTLLAEDPALSGASPTLYHSILTAIANGSVTAGKIANRLQRSVSNLDPALKRLIASGFVVRHEDPIRAQRPTYALADPLGLGHLSGLEKARAALGTRASSARLLLFAQTFKGDLIEQARSRTDVELIDLERLYHGE